MDTVALHTTHLGLLGEKPRGEGVGSRDLKSSHAHSCSTLVKDGGRIRGPRGTGKVLLAVAGLCELHLKGGKGVHGRLSERAGRLPGVSSPLQASENASAYTSENHLLLLFLLLFLSLLLRLSA